MNPSIGFLGLGAMGLPMARNLVERGFVVRAWDPREEARAAFASTGGIAAASENEATAGDVVLLSLPHSDLLVTFARESLLPKSRHGQVFVDFTTVIPREVRSLAKAFAERGACYLDCPVPGGPGGVEQRVLRVFAGGDVDAFERVRPLLEAISAPEWVFHCGGSGCGQSVKGVNQLGMGLIQAAAMEAVHYGIASGVPAGLIGRAVGGGGGFRGLVKGLCDQIEKDAASGIPIKYDQFGFFLDEAGDRGFDLPVVEFLYSLLKDQPTPVRDANQFAPSYWDYLSR